MISSINIYQHHLTLKKDTVSKKGILTLAGKVTI